MLDLTADQKEQVASVMRKIAASMSKRVFVRDIIRRDVSSHKWELGYSWHRTGANRITGIVHDVTVSRGATFDEALAKAIGKLGAA